MLSLRRLKAISVGLGLLIVAYAVGYLIPSLQSVPKDWTLTTAPFWSAAVSWININLFDYIEAVKTVLLLKLLVPFKLFLLAQPWPWALLVLTAAGYLLGGCPRTRVVARV